MISRENFIFTIGYKRDTAVVSGELKRKYARYSLEELLKEGLFKPAVSFALYDGSEEELKMVLDSYNRMTDYPVSSVEELKRIFGVTRVPEEVEKVLVL